MKASRWQRKQNPKMVRDPRKDVETVEQREARIKVKLKQKLAREREEQREELIEVALF